jgi:RNA methyltransferase, TrmH family
MIPCRLSSLQHPLVKKLVKLRESRPTREEEGAVLLSGETVIQEISQTCVIKNLISTKPLSIRAEKHHLATEEVLQKIIGHATDDLVAAEIATAPHSDLTKTQLIVVLDQIQDPGNVGTIFRTALALGWDGVFVIEGTADPYNDKALRASRGAPLRLPWCEGSWDDLSTFPHHPFVADIQGAPLAQMKFSKPLMLVLGHETRGPSKSARQRGSLITIPMKGAMESLNVASAASIMLYHIQEVLS